jgi:hypothetical protein
MDDEPAVDNVVVLPGGIREDIPLTDVVSDALEAIERRRPDTVIIITRERTGELRCWTTCDDLDRVNGIMVRAQQWMVNEIVDHLDAGRVLEEEDAG